MILKEVSNSLIQGIGVRLLPHRFKFDGRKKYFKRETQKAVQIFDLIFTKKKEGIYVEPTIRIKINSIEDIYHQVAMKDPSYFEGTTTILN